MSIVIEQALLDAGGLTKCHFVSGMLLRQTRFGDIVVEQVAGQLCVIVQEAGGCQLVQSVTEDIGWKFAQIAVWVVRCADALCVNASNAC
jgi:hypothetical protein